MKKNIIYLEGLNGLRAIAALTVVIGHVTLFKYSSFNLPTIKLGMHGVTLFFVISGFLITYLLLNEKKETDTINIKKFYFRRILRIWPIYYLMIFICLIAAKYNDNISDIYSKSILYYLFFCANIPILLSSVITIIAHFWSIGVEEQFYLFWPWVVKSVRKKFILITVGIILVFYSLKIGTYLFLGNHSILYLAFHFSRFHCMLLGAVGARLYFENNKFFISTFSNIYVQILAWIVTPFVYLNILYVPAPVSAELMAILSIILLVGQISPNKRKIINLENRFFDFLGKISYGIYVIHPLIILLFSSLYKNLSLSVIPKTIIVYSSVVITTVLVSYISYEYYEKPFLKIKKKFMVVESSNSIDRRL